MVTRTWWLASKKVIVVIVTTMLMLSGSSWASGYRFISAEIFDSCFGLSLAIWLAIGWTLIGQDTILWASSSIQDVAASLPDAFNAHSEISGRRGQNASCHHWLQDQHWRHQCNTCKLCCTCCECCLQLTFVHCFVLEHRPLLSVVLNSIEWLVLIEFSAIVWLMYRWFPKTANAHLIDWLLDQAHKDPLRCHSWGHSESKLA